MGRVGWRVAVTMIVLTVVLFYPFPLAEISGGAGPRAENEGGAVVTLHQEPAAPPAGNPVNEAPIGEGVAVIPGEAPAQPPPADHTFEGEGGTPTGEDALAPGQALAAEAEPLKPARPEPLQVVYRAEADDRVGLSFDDGPHPRLTERYLEVLDQYHVQATFFVVGERVHLFPEAARLVAEQGNEIGSHSWRHARLDELDLETVSGDLASVAREVYATTGQEVTLFRPPYGRYAEPVLAAAQSLHQQVVLWNTDPRDWEDPSPAEITRRVLEQAKPGSIIILHEGHQNTLKALPKIIEGLRDRRLEPVPVSELLAPGQPAPPPPAALGGGEEAA